MLGTRENHLLQLPLFRAHPADGVLSAHQNRTYNPWPGIFTSAKISRFLPQYNIAEYFILNAILVESRKILVFNREIARSSVIFKSSWAGGVMRTLKGSIKIGEYDTGDPYQSSVVLFFLKS